MLFNLASTPLTLRAEQPGDAAAIRRIFDDRRQDLQLIDAEPDFVQMVVDQQFDAMHRSMADYFPNARRLVIEHMGEVIGRLVVDAGPVELRVIELGFVQEARGRGHARQILQALQEAGRLGGLPVSITTRIDDLRGRAALHGMGFASEGQHGPFERLGWYPSKTGSQ
jgi:RimJ/RimL family protein N-acetyltransferase